MHRRLIVTCLVLLAACAPQGVPSAVPSSSVPASGTPAAATSPADTRDPTGVLSLTAPPSLPPTLAGAIPTLVPTIGTALTPQPGLILRGTVQLADGSGLPDVKICRSFASYPGTVVATTDASGNFQSDFAFIPGDEMVGVWAVAPGYTFQPETYRWRHYHGSEDRGLDFIAAPETGTAAAAMPCQ